MLWQSLPEFGTGVLYAILVCAAYTFAVSIAAGRNRPRLLESARLGAYGVCGLVLLGVFCLAYAFITHDFRIRYVAHYSERAMSNTFLLTALWGGQDGSLLWWLFLLSVYITACVAWLKGKYRHLQPYVIATLMVIVSFFAMLMLFAANPFETNLAGSPVDGEGLNPLLQDFYMIIHPPSLYTGFVGCSIPFSFAMAALITGRLDNEWINATRKWMMFAWMFLSIGNALGMLWAYKELGWGGYWAWDPVENAACLPWFTASAYVHSTMIQERRNLMKTWNLVLICITFFLTIFGTFLTRSGLISSVHSFAKSDIGSYFLWAMGAIVATSAGLIVWRRPLLKGSGRIESVLSREAAFVVNNWAFLGGCTFIGVATIWPRISEWLWQQSVTVGPPFFNRWMTPIGLVILLLMGVAPLFGWRKTSGVSLKRAFAFPLGAAALVAVAHMLFGASVGFPPLVYEEAHYEGIVGQLLKQVGATAPLITTTLVGLNFAVILQEFARGIAARRKNSQEGVFEALLNLVSKSRRRYGGYVVHFGIGLIFLGFAGKAWEIEKEANLLPGQSVQVGAYTLTYKAPRMEVDAEKRMIFTDLAVTSGGRELGNVSPGKFIYKKQQMPTTEVSILSSLRDDLYLAIGTVDPSSKLATFRIHVNPLVSWIWVGVLILIGGAGISLWPDVSFKQLGVWQYVRASAGVTSGVMMAILIATSPAHALTLHALAPPIASEMTAVSGQGSSGSSPLPQAPQVPWAPLGALLGGFVLAGVFTPWVLRKQQK
ncbi:MAG TPA: cytochrome c-type biogenesis CcmF C-terminal domain-containing protein [Polyangiaceae bacterium]|nr:cytochrome c-type biogenesis CcmF C-terminal domain-containing protein [Polyangiaceae bacterium]